MKIKQIAENIKKQSSTKGKVLIAIEGFGGSGKSTMAKQLKIALQDAYIVGIDDFIVKAKLAEPSWDRGVFDHERLEKQVLIPATTGDDVMYQKLIWTSDSLSEPVTAPRVRYLIVEGISSYHPSIAKYYDFKIWIDTPIKLAKERGHARDGGNENAQHWDLWAENDLKYQQKYRPEQIADFIIKN